MSKIMLIAVIFTFLACEKTPNIDNFIMAKEDHSENIVVTPLPAEITPIVPAPFGPSPLIYPVFGGGKNKNKGRNRSPEFEYVHFVPNYYSFWIDPANATTHLLANCTGDSCACTPGQANCQSMPAFANIVVEEENFVWCKGGPFALCYYSGPDDGSTDLSCKLSADGQFANCKCFEIPWGAYMVDINAILNYSVYQATIATCGANGALCSGSDKVNIAPVCQAVNDNTLIPGAHMLSTFSFDCASSDGFGSTNCGANFYAGCMTAPCQRTSTPGIVECSCPTFFGPYQVGSAINPEQCLLGNDLVWSAAFSPAGVTVPPADPCVPDAPGGSGCPLLPTNFIPASPEDCVGICEAYACQNAQGIEPAYTCDSTLCTGQCNERPLIKAACEDLGDCPAEGIIAIANLEAKKNCSCCASQLCQCTPNEATNHAIYDLDQRQRDLDIIPQCDTNMTLCGTPPLVSKETRFTSP